MRKELIVGRGDLLFQRATRRRFLGMLAAAGTIVLLPSVFTGCSDDDGITDPTLDPDAYRLDLSTDTGILNYAYALEQLEAVFYTAALTSPGYASLTTAEQEVLSDLQKHEVIHRELFKQALGTAAIPSVAFNATTVASLMTDRATLLASAQLLEDTGVSAYNGAGKYLTTAANLLVAAKIVSVEARHAAAIRDIRDGTNGTLFAGDDVVSAAGLDVKAEPSAVLGSLANLNLLVSPVAIGTMPTGTATADQPAPAAAVPTATIKAVLDFALALEIFENEFYKAVLGTSSSTAQNNAFATVRVKAQAVPGVVPTLQQIQKHEAAHVATLLAAGAQNAFNLSAASFDFTGNRSASGGGPYAAATTDLPFLLAVAQGFEDAAVRAYKGQVTSLMSDSATLEAVLRIHSVEARHVARIRRIRRATDTANATVRYSGTIRGGGAAAAGAGAQSAVVTAAFEKIYGQGTNSASAPSEANLTQAAVSVTSLSAAQFGTNAATEAFDEPLDRADVVAIVQPFFIPTIS
ncbi:MAG: ferritin-like domain-containing protein [Gemmatimonadaceae bacterium]